LLSIEKRVNIFIFIGDGLSLLYYAMNNIYDTLHLTSDNKIWR